MEQVHGVRVKVIRSIRDFPLSGEAVRRVDGVIFGKYFKDIAVGVRVADCMPVFVFTDNRLAAFMHVGWRGLKKELPLKVAAALKQNREIFVYVGPHICWKCFSLEGEKVNLFLEMKDQLIKAGIKRENIKLLKKNNYCTYENKEYFSHRRGNPQRMLAFVIQH